MTNLRINSVVCLLCLVVYTQAVANPESLQPEGNPIKTEASASLLYSHFAEDFVWGSTGSRLLDSLGFTVGGQYYFDSRFVNPAVPFAFIPYDYRRNSIGLLMGYSTEEATWAYNAWDRGPASEDPDYLLKVAVFSMGGYCHTSRLFFGGSFLFQRETISGSERLLQFSATGGWLAREWKFGIRSVISKESERVRLGWFYADQVNVTGQPFLEYTPGSFVRVRAAVSLTCAVTYGDHWEMELPVTLSYTIPDRWWEFEIASVYFENRNDVKRYTFEATTRRYVGDGSIYALGGLTHGDLLFIPWRDHDTIASLGLGGDFVYNRIIQLTLQYKYEFGDPISTFCHDNRRGHVLAATLRFFD